jgi:glycosyltransferase involved in cell wall biosynthesis
LFPVFWLMFSLPRYIICNSEGVKAKIVEYGVRPSKIVPIPAFSLQYLEPAEGQLPADLDAFYSRFDEVVFCYLKMRSQYYPITAVEGFSRLAARRPRVGLVLAGVDGHSEANVSATVQTLIAQPDLRDRVILVEDLPHDQFLQAVSRSTVFLRTPVSDGVCSSLLEALALRVPVVAAENHTRPAGVITYPPDDVDALASILDDVLSRRDQIAADLQQPEIRDTLSEEAALLTASA